MTTRKRISGFYGGAQGGGGGPTPTTGLLAWGPDFGGVDGDQFAVAVEHDFTNLGLTNEQTIQVQTLLTSLGIGDLDGAGVQVNTDFTALAANYNINQVQVDSNISALAVDYGAIFGVQVATDIFSVSYFTDVAGSYSLTAPSNSNSAEVELVGGGGRGGASLVNGGGGGGGGEYARANAYSVTGGNSYDLEVGAGATASVLAGASTFDTTGVVANGGANGAQGAALGQGGGGAGGSGGTGDVTFNGGSGGGGGGVQTNGGGGGGSGGSAGAGGNGSSGGTGGAAGTPDGGEGADGGNLTQPARNGSQPGGGGGGASATQARSLGFDGQARVTFFIT